MTRILVLVADADEQLPGLEALPDSVQVQTVSDEAELRDALPEADILVVTDFRTGLLERCWPDEPKLCWVHATSAGVDALLFPALVDSPIMLTNARGLFDRGIAEYVLGAVLMFAKDTHGNLRLQAERNWQHRDTELIDQRQVLVVGAGSIGAQVARLLGAVGMQVTGIASKAREHEDFVEVLGQESLHDALPKADFVVITAPLNDATEGMFDRQAFAAMKPGARLINVGRGPIVKTDALLAALEAGEIAGAALDVFEEEPLPAEHPLWSQPQVMVSAHMAGDFIGWRRALGEQFVANFQRWQAGEALFNQVKKR
ncbi:MAG: D-2-hydroxyacid dehydrogenase [Pseudomonadaceae bacterium]|nr:MAG: D-2-hydroxyacid dehydrogenase [Pseudomonadaceae bacterium]